MIELFILAMLAVVGLSVAAIIGFVFFLLKMVLWIGLLPARACCSSCCGCRSAWPSAPSAWGWVSSRCRCCFSCSAAS